MVGAFSRDDLHPESIEFLLLHDITTVLSSSLNLKDTLSAIFERLNAQLGLKRSVLTLFHPIKNEFQIELAHGVTTQDFNSPLFGVWSDITSFVLKDCAVTLVNPFGEMVVLGQHTPKQLEEAAYICLPVFLGKETFGTLSIHGEFVFKNDFYQIIKLFFVVTLMIAQEIKLKRILDLEKQNLRQENITLREELKEKYSIDNMIGSSSAMVRVYECITQVANSNATVLIYGESGTGKELVAHAIHYRSSRATSPFIKINCGAIPESLIESELFGYEKGAFTDAYERRMGKFEAANNGTIFLDEIGELPLSMQVKLLRVIQEREFLRVGGVDPVKVNVRVIAATNRDLEVEMKKGAFRQDLYYRLNVFPIFIPSLSERSSDVLLLAEHFLEKFSKENQKIITSISPQVVDLLMRYSWPGNVRELENCMERAVLVCDGGVLLPIHLPKSFQNEAYVLSEESENSLEEQVKLFEKNIIVNALMVCKGSQLNTAKLLKTTQRVIGYKIKNYGIDPSLFK